MCRFIPLLLGLGLILTACSSNQKTNVSRVPAAALVVGRDGGVILVHKSQNGMYAIKQCQDFVPVNKEQDCRLAPGTETREVTKQQIVGEITRILQLPRFKPEISEEVSKRRRAEQAQLFRCNENLSMLKYEIYRRQTFGETHGFFREDLSKLEALLKQSEKASCSTAGVNKIQKEIDAINKGVVIDIVALIESEKLHIISSPQAKSRMGTDHPDKSEPTLEQEISKELGDVTKASSVDVKRWQVSAGNYHTCAIDDEGVKCWGQSGQSKIPALQNPRQVSAGIYHTCALDDEGVKCWGDNTYGQTKVPVLRNPRQVSAGINYTCAIDDEGVKCWGHDKYSQTKVPVLRNPRQVSAGNTHTCAIDDEGVKCWGQYGKTKVPALRNPRQVSVDTFHTCAIDDEGVKCWGSNDDGQIKVPALRNPRQVSAGTYHTCALDDDGVKCWGGNWGQYGQTKVPALRNPRQVSAGTYHTCALDDDGVKCWGSNDNRQMEVPLSLQLK